MKLDTRIDLRHFAKDCVKLMIKYWIKKEEAEEWLYRSSLYTMLYSMIWDKDKKSEYLNEYSSKKEIAERINEIYDKINK